MRYATWFRLGSVLLIWACCSINGSWAGEAARPKLVKTIPLPGINGPLDQCAIDVQGRRLFVAAPDNGTVEVIDLAQGTRLHSFTNLSQPAGVAYLPGVNRIAVGNGAEGACKLFDAKSYKLIKSLGGFDQADDLQFDARANLIYQGYGAGALALVDATGLNRVGNIQLRAHPESFQLEQDGPRVFVNLPAGNQVTVIDRRKRLVEATWTLKDFKANFALALDETNQRLFIGCRQPPRLVVLDAQSGRPVMNLVISGDAGALSYDAARRCLYLSCGEGFLDVIEQRQPNVYLRRERIGTRPGTRTSLFSAVLSELYLALPAATDLPAEVRVYQVR